TVDLSNTPIRDRDILQLFIANGDCIGELILNGCNNLTFNTVTHVKQYCSNLMYISMWNEASEETILDMCSFNETNLEFRYIDLSYCENITDKVLLALKGFKFINLKEIMGTFTFKGLRKFASVATDIEV